MRYKVGDVVLCCERTRFNLALEVNKLYDIVKVDEGVEGYLLRRSGSEGFLHYLSESSVHRYFKFVGGVSPKEEDML